MTLKDRNAQLEAENAQLRQQVIQLTDALVKAYEAMTPAQPIVTTPYTPQPVYRTYPLSPHVPYYGTICQGVQDSETQVTFNADWAPEEQDKFLDRFQEQRGRRKPVLCRT